MKKTKSQEVPIVLLHGFMGSTLAHFGKVIKVWYKKIPIIGIDLPGHGMCQYSGQVDYYEDAVHYVIHAIQKYKKVYLIGASYLGGTIAVKISHIRRDLISKLVITGFSYDIPKNAFCAWANNFRTLVEINPDLEKEYNRLHGARWIDTMNLIINNINNNYDNYIRISKNDLTELKLPSLLINGDYKENEMNAAIHFSKLSKYFSSQIISGAGHIVPYDNPDMFCNRIEQFLHGTNYE